MGVHATFFSAIKSVAAAFSGSSAPAAVRHGGGAHPSGAAHVHLGEGAHPLLVGEAQAVKPSPGKALLQRIGDLSSTPMAALLERMPAHPAFMPLQRVADHLTQKTFGSPHSANHQFVGSLPQTRMGGFVSMPQGPVLLPGGSPIPKLSGKLERPIDPNAMQPSVEGGPVQAWEPPQEKIVPVGVRPEDLMHLAQDHDDAFKKWLDSTVGGDRGKLEEMLSSEKATGRAPELIREMVNEALEGRHPQGPNQIAGQVHGSQIQDQSVYWYQPSIKGPMDTEIPLPHLGNEDEPIGVVGKYYSGADTLLISVNSKYADPDWANHFGSGDAMVKSLLETAKSGGVTPTKILVRPNGLQTSRGSAYVGQVGYLIDHRTGVGPAHHEYALMDQDIREAFKRIEGVVPIIDAGYQVTSIRRHPGDGNKIYVGLVRRPSPTP